MSTCAISPADAMIGTSQVPDATSTLVARAKEGDAEAFGKLFELHKRKVYSICLRMTGDVAEAEDLTQDAFLQVFRKLAMFRGESLFTTWLYRVAVNTVLMSLREKRPKQVSLDEPVPTESSDAPREVRHDDLNLLGAVDRIALATAISDLPPGCRMIFLLHDVEGYQHHEIAKMLGCSAGNSKSQLHKARWKMRAVLFPDHEFVSGVAKKTDTRGDRLREMSATPGQRMRAAG